MRSIAARRARGLSAALLAALLSAALLAGCGAVGGGSSYLFTGVFASGQGLFPGSQVQVLGLTEGTVKSVHNEGNVVVVGMSLPTAVPVPADVHAVMVAPELLGQRSIDLEPGYTGGPRLPAGAVIPESRTSVPVETNQILNQLTRYLAGLHPGNVHNLIVNLAQDLSGQGQALNDLIGHAAGTIQLLAAKGNQLGQLNGTLAQLTGTLDSRTAAIESLVTDYDAVSGVVAQDRVQLGAAVQDLSRATTQLAGLLGPNVSGLESDLSTLTTAGRTIDRNLGAVDLGLSSSVALFAGAKRAYDPVHQWLSLNNQAPSGDNSTVLANDVRDRLAGVCRRVLAHHAAGLSAAETQTLQRCGDPASGYFDPILGLIPTIIGSGPGQSQPTPGNPGAAAVRTRAAEQVFRTGLGRIPGLDGAQRTSLAAVPIGPGPTGAQDQVAALVSPRGLPPLTPPPGGTAPTIPGRIFHPFWAAAHALGSFLGGLL